MVIWDTEYVDAWPNTAVATRANNEFPDRRGKALVLEAKHVYVGFHMREASFIVFDKDEPEETAVCYENSPHQHGIGRRQTHGQRKILEF